MNGLIGYTGFVGSNIKQQFDIDYCFNTANSDKITNYEYDILFCAAPSAVKWKANQDPYTDTQYILNLVKSLEGVKAQRFILFSTIDVYATFPKTEEDKPDIYDTSFYGKNRILLENYIINMFNNHHIIRLPGLFGQGLKKNIIFDLLNNNVTNVINVNDSYQWFYLQDLHKVTKYVMDNNIKIYNVATEPITNLELIRYTNIVLNQDYLMNTISKTKYDIKSIYNTNYLYTKIEMLEKLNEFISIKHSI